MRVYRLFVGVLLCLICFGISKNWFQDRLDPRNGQLRIQDVKLLDGGRMISVKRVVVVHGRLQAAEHVPLTDPEATKLLQARIATLGDVTVSSVNDRFASVPYAVRVR